MLESNGSGYGGLCGIQLSTARARRLKPSRATAVRRGEDCRGK